MQAMLLAHTARCMAAKTPQIATLSCILAGIATFIVGVPFAYLGGFARLYYGPDSPYAEFEADTYVLHRTFLRTAPSCSACDTEPRTDTAAAAAVLVSLMQHYCYDTALLLTGAAALLACLAAASGYQMRALSSSLSQTSSQCVMLAISTVLSHNVGTIAIKAITPSKPITQAQLMLIVRCSVPIVAIIAAVVASTYNETGYLIVVAFD
eukprot:3779-Heterococcus_DN1.PRE.5